jgi:hypothetical protein
MLLRTMCRVLTAQKRVHLPGQLQMSYNAHGSLHCQTNSSNP